jgi:hypothetical protein
MLVKRAKKACGARTETETVTTALQDLVVRDKIDRAFRRYGPARRCDGELSFYSLFTSCLPQEPSIGA